MDLPDFVWCEESRGFFFFGWINRFLDGILLEAFFSCVGEKCIYQLIFKFFRQRCFSNKKKKCSFGRNQILSIFDHLKLIT